MGKKLLLLLKRGIPAFGLQLWESLTTRTWEQITPDKWEG